MSDLTDRVAIVTGAAAGIGLATAKLLAREGATVILTDIDDAKGTIATRDLVAIGAKASFLKTDISREEDVRGMIDYAVKEQGALDILFNNAGVAGKESPITETEKDEWDRVLATNLTSTFMAMKYGIEAMLKGRGGSIVNNASVLGLVGFNNNAAYAASKAGVIQLTRSAAIEYARKGIRVNCICPGAIDTPMLEGADAAQTSRNSLLKLLVPMRRFGSPNEIAELAVFLASDRSSFMTGAVIPVDGGFVAS